MRRTLALLGAAALAVVALASPASASQPGDISFSDVHPGSASSPMEAWYDLESTTGLDQSLENHTVLGCVANDTTPTKFVDYAATDLVPAVGIHRTADPGAVTVSPDKVWDNAASGELEGTIFDLRLVEDFEGANEQVIARSASATPPNSTCLAQLPPV